MRGTRTLVAATSAAVVVGLLAVPAQAVAPVPRAVVALPSALDNAAFYEPQTVCDPTPRPGATALKNLLVATYGPATVYIPRACTSSTSEHFDGRAVDWMRSVRVPAQKAMADAFVSWLLAPARDGTPHEMARRLGIMYIIWNNRMIRMYDPGRGWTNYRNCLAAANSGTGLDTSCHRNHVHLSLSWDGAAALTSWWTGVAQAQAYCPRRRRAREPGSANPGWWRRVRRCPPRSPSPRRRSSTHVPEQVRGWTSPVGSSPDAPCSPGHPCPVASRTGLPRSCCR
jgi:hypothetical protein